MAWAKQHRERQKWTRFDAFSLVKQRRAVLTIATPGVVFFVIILSWILYKISRFLHPWCEQSSTGNDKNERVKRFWCVFAGQATVWVFDHCNTGCDTFSCSFCGDFRCILTSFCKILDARLEAWSRCMNGPWSTSKCVIFITFWSVFDPAKIELQPLLCGFPEKWN